MIYVKKNPSPDTLAEVRNTPAEGFIPMEQCDFDVWQAAEILGGWNPVHSTSVPVPENRPRYKLRLWLNSQGILAAVESKIATASEEVKILWNERPDVRRDSALVESFGKELGLSSAQIDAAFIAASALD